MARVTVHLYASFRAYADGAANVDVEIQPGDTVGQVLAKVGVPAEQTRILFVNNRAATLDDPLQGGERIGAFPAIGGG
jgi:molybdopterin converting factor small subunit